MRSSLVLLLVLVLVLERISFPAEPDFPLTEDSKTHADFPKGELIKGQYTAKDGSVFPGTERDYTIYLPPSPKGRDQSDPAPFMVFQDGVIYQAPAVFDNLIAKKEIPPLIGIFIKPGIVPAANPNALPRYNRSYEYDSVTDTYARFLIDEFLPAIEARHGIRLSTDPDDAAISGNSSGGIAAFMVAWHRPERFRRVFSSVGTYVGIHGADQLPVLIRKYEPKPLRVFLQSGTGDNNLYCGDWWMANQTMERALTWAGYEVNHIWGEGGHNAKHASQIFPEVLRWLWRDYATAKQIKPNPRGESKWKGYDVLGDGKWEVSWERPAYKDGIRPVGEVSSLAAKANGDVFASLGVARSIGWSLPSGRKPWQGGQIQSAIDHFKEINSNPSCPGWPPFAGGLLFIPTNSKPVVIRQLELGELLHGLAIKKDGKLLCSAYGGRDFPTLFEVEESGNEFPGSWKWKALADDAAGFSSQSIVATHSGTIYFVGEINGGGAIRAYRLPDLKQIDDEHDLQRFPAFIPGASHIAISPDQTLLYVTSSLTSYLFSCRIKENGALADCQPFYQLQTDEDGFVAARGLCVDTNGWLYVATALGIQVCDQAGRVNFIIPTPQPPHDVCFGGKDLSSIFIACGDKIYKRQTKAHGIVSGQMAPIKPAPPKL